MKEIEVIKMLLDACSSLMDELGGSKAADWGLINNALVEGERLVIKHERRSHFE